MLLLLLLLLLSSSSSSSSQQHLHGVQSQLLREFSLVYYVYIQKQRMSAVFFIMCRNQVLSPVDSLVNLCLVVGTESPYRDAVSMAILRLHEAATADSPGGSTDPASAGGRPASAVVQQVVEEGGNVQPRRTTRRQEGTFWSLFVRTRMTALDQGSKSDRPR